MQQVEDGYPKGSMKFVIKDSKTYPNLGLCRSHLLVIPR